VLRPASSSWSDVDGKKEKGDVENRSIAGMVFRACRRRCVCGKSSRCGERSSGFLPSPVCPWRPGCWRIRGLSESGVWILVFSARRLERLQPLGVSMAWSRCRTSQRGSRWPPARDSAPALFRGRSARRHPHHGVHQKTMGSRRSMLTVSPAGVGPAEIGRNRKYVFALPPRFANDGREGVREVVAIVTARPLRAIPISHESTLRNTR
jgi:hypothetical protein